MTPCTAWMGDKRTATQIRHIGDIWLPCSMSSHLTQDHQMALPTFPAPSTFPDLHLEKFLPKTLFAKCLVGTRLTTPLIPSGYSPFYPLLPRKRRIPRRRLTRIAAAFTATRKPLRCSKRKSTSLHCPVVTSRRRAGGTFHVVERSK